MPDFGRIAPAEPFTRSNTSTFAWTGGGTLVAAEMRTFTLLFFRKLTAALGLECVAVLQKAW